MIGKLWLLSSAALVFFAAVAVFHSIVKQSRLFRCGFFSFVFAGQIFRKFLGFFS